MLFDYHLRVIDECTISVVPICGENHLCICFYSNGEEVTHFNYQGVQLGKVGRIRDYLNRVKENNKKAASIKDVVTLVDMTGKVHKIIFEEKD